MDSVISSVIGGIIEGYFSIFFKNFRKESFSLNTGTSETSSQLHNLGRLFFIFLDLLVVMRSMIVELSGDVNILWLMVYRDQH